MKDLSARAARPADGLGPGPGPRRGPGPGHLHRGGAVGHHPAVAADLQVGPGRLSSFGIATFLLVYYAASGFFTIYYSTVFVNPNGLNFSVAQANHLNEWFWGADAVALIVFGVLSDLFKVRKPFMLVGAIGAIVTLIVFLNQTTHAHTSFYTLVGIEVVLAAFLSLAYAPWMAGYTEMVEKKNPALVGTGLALWGWILRLVVGISFIFLPLVITSVSPIVDNQPVATQTIPGTTYSAQTFQAAHPASVGFAVAYAAFLGVLNEPARPRGGRVAASPTRPTWPVGVPSGRRTRRCSSSTEAQLPNWWCRTRKSSTTSRPTRPPSPICRTVWPTRQTVAALVLGVRRGHGDLPPDHLAQPGTVEPEASPRGRGPARRGRGPRAEGVGRGQRLRRGPGPTPGAAARRHTGDLPWTAWTPWIGNSTSGPDSPWSTWRPPGSPPTWSGSWRWVMVVLDRGGREVGSFCSSGRPGSGPGSHPYPRDHRCHGGRRPHL